MGCSLFNVLADYGPFLYPADESLLTLAKVTYGKTADEV